MGIYRLYTGDDGQSHIEAQHPSSHPDVTAPQVTQPIAVFTPPSIRISKDTRRAATLGCFSPWVICLDVGAKKGY